MRSGTLNVGLMKTENYEHNAMHVQNQIGTLMYRDQKFCLLEYNGMKETL